MLARINLWCCRFVCALFNYPFLLNIHIARKTLSMFVFKCHNYIDDSIVLIKSIYRGLAFAIVRERDSIVVWKFLQKYIFSQTDIFLLGSCLEHHLRHMTHVWLCRLHTFLKSNIYPCKVLWYF